MVIEMDKMDLILWIMGGGFSLIFSLMLVMWQSLNKRMQTDYENLNKRMDSNYENLNKRMDSHYENLNKRIDSLECKIEKLDEKLTDVDRRLCRLEGAFASKDCCMIKEDKHLRKAE